MALINLSSKVNDFETSYANSPINLSDLKGQIALKAASLWYSWDNITEEYENNEIKYRIKDRIQNTELKMRKVKIRTIFLSQTIALLLNSNRNRTGKY